VLKKAHILLGAALASIGVAFFTFEIPFHIRGNLYRRTLSSSIFLAAVFTLILHALLLNFIVIFLADFEV
jgi:hypothetical protein